MLQNTGVDQEIWGGKTQESHAMEEKKKDKCDYIKL